MYLRLRGEKPLQIGELPLQVFGEVVNDLCSLSFLLLSGEDCFPKLPVQDDQLLVNGKGHFELCPADARVEVSKKDVIIVGREQGIVLRQGTFPLFAGILLSG